MTSVAVFQRHVCTYDIDSVRRASNAPLPAVPVLLRHPTSRTASCLVFTTTPDDALPADSDPPTAKRPPYFVFARPKAEESALRIGTAAVVLAIADGVSATMGGLGYDFTRVPIAAKLSLLALAVYEAFALCSNCLFLLACVARRNMVRTIVLCVLAFNYLSILLMDFNSMMLFRFLFVTAEIAYLHHLRSAAMYHWFSS